MALIQLDDNVEITATFRKGGKVWSESLHRGNLFNILESIKDDIEERKHQHGVLLSDNETLMEYEVEII